MKNINRRVVEFAMWSCCVLGLLLNAAPARAGTGKILLAGTDQKLILADVSSGQGITLQAVALPAALGAGESAFLSPGERYLTVIGPKGVLVYGMAAGAPQQPTRVTDSPVTRAVWSEDGAALVYVAESRSADGSIAVQIFTWDATTRQTKRLL